jgi:5'-methylthioadenosine phosphorylase
MEELRAVRRVRVETPFGAPSAEYTLGELPGAGGGSLPVVFLPRHGARHTLLPGEINYRANLHGLKQLGVTHLLAVSAVGSLQEQVAPGSIVLPDQFLDRTARRASSFFGEGAVAHVPFGDPTDPGLRAIAGAAARACGAQVHDGGTCVVMEGPAFSTRAESESYRALGARVIGMTALPEAKLAREAELSYAMLAMVTDYDCWRAGEESVTAHAVLDTLRANASLARATVRECAARLPYATRELPPPAALAHALVTPAEALTPAVRARLDLILGHYL